MNKKLEEYLCNSPLEHFDYFLETYFKQLSWMTASELYKVRACGPNIDHKNDLIWVQTRKDEKPFFQSNN